MMCMTSLADENSATLDVDRLFAAPELNGPSPNKITISPDSSHVTFLRGKQSDPLQQDLWEYDLAGGTTHLLVDSAMLLPGPEKLSDAERARRERLRISSSKGIVDYQFSPDGKKLLFPLSGDLFIYLLDSRQVRRITESDAAEIDPKFSSTGKFLSFVRDNNLYIVDLDDDNMRQLTRDGSSTIKNATAEFIAQEEMDRYTGYWWSPDDSAIAFIRVDQTPLRSVKRFEVYADNFKVLEQRYPAAGTRNVTVQLGVVDISKDNTRWMSLGEDADIYLPRVKWFPDSRFLAVQRQSRDQKTLDLMKIDTRNGASRVLLTETSNTWVNLHNELRFLHSSPQFIWASERSGFKHLYLYNNEGKLLHALTAGEWNVTVDGRAKSAILQLDEDHRRLYVTGTYDSPLERNIYAVSLGGDNKPERLSGDPGWHDATFAPDGSFYVDTFENPATPPQVALRRADGTLIDYIEPNRLNATHPYSPYLAEQPTTEFGRLKAEDGQVLYYRIKKPAHFDARNKYPVIVTVYGGPHGQQVARKWSAGFEEVLTGRGYIVFSLDNRGTGSRGVAFDAPIYRRMGRVEVIDQMTGVSYLQTLDFVDSARIGIFGWSYGGYMTLMCMFQQPEAFAAGVAGAPVTDWTLYDTHYTERYLGTPQQNAEGYRNSSVFPYAKNLADPLLIIHGMADDNVLFSNSTKLFKALQDADLGFEMMTYPGSKHALLRHPDTGRHAYGTILRFFDSHLMHP